MTAARTACVHHCLRRNHKAGQELARGKLDQSKRAQILFMDREDILDLFVVTNIPLPPGAVPEVSWLSDDIPF